MYKQIILENTITKKEIKIPLLEGVNLIVGPRGGGKSSLLELLAGISLNVRSKKVKAVFKGTELKPFEFKKAIEKTNEEINNSSLNDISDKEAKNKYDSKDNIIAQDDTTKKNLVDMDSIEKHKTNIAKNISQGEGYIKLFENFEDLKRNFSNIDSAYKETEMIYWQNVFRIDETSDKENIFINLNYDSNQTNRLLKRAISRFKDFKNEIDDYLYKTKEFDSFIKSYDPFLKGWKDNLKSLQAQSIDMLQKTKKIIDQEIKKIKKFQFIAKLCHCFHMR